MNLRHQQVMKSRDLLGLSFLCVGAKRVPSSTTSAVSAHIVGSSFKMDRSGDPEFRRVRQRQNWQERSALGLGLGLGWYEITMAKCMGENMLRFFCEALSARPGPALHRMNAAIRLQMILVSTRAPSEKSDTPNHAYISSSLNELTSGREQ